MIRLLLFFIGAASVIACSSNNTTCSGPSPTPYSATYTPCADAGGTGCYASCAEACTAQKPPDPPPNGGPAVTGSAKCLGVDGDGGTLVAQCEVVYCGAQ